MRVYHQLVFDQFIEGTTVLYTNPALNAQLALTEHVELFALADTVSGTLPTLTVQIEESPDAVMFTNRNSAPEINGVALSTALNTTAVGRDPGVKLGTGFARLRVQIGGSSQKAHVQIWATGIRDYGDHPLTILGTGVVAWWRSDLGITLNGATVSAWATAGGVFAISLAQGTGANQPTFNATGGPNSKPSILFDGSNDVLSDGGTDIGPPGPFFFWAVLRQVTWTAGRALWGFGAAGYNLFQSGVSPALVESNITSVNSNNALTLNTYKRVEVYFSNSTSDYLKVGSTSVTGANAGNTDPGAGMALGAQTSAAGFSNLEICEWFVSTPLPSASQRAALDAYCTARYGPGLV